jgi:hypothetical protein
MSCQPLPLEPLYVQRFPPSAFGRGARVEVDSFTDRDGEQSKNASYVRQVINSFLECLDGTAGRERVVVVGRSSSSRRRVRAISA